ncbi:MAG: hypothetical protein GX942_01835 [Papillibacter sp.]|nr:hypothetical protein [Papillibacter sp.]
MKKNIDNEFKTYTDTLSEADRDLLTEYFSRLSQHIILPKSLKKAMIEDFEKALIFYLKSGLSVASALSRLDSVNLGGFYARPPILWYPADDGAKIYPLSMKRHQMAVFRLSAYLKEDVVPELLQIALTFTIQRFPSFAVTVKNGFFWHYMDASKRRYYVEPETEIPGSPLKVSSTGSPAFRVIFYKNRISTEFFHILTDGTGGMILLKTLTAVYLRLCGHEIECGEGVLNINEAPQPGETTNDFNKAEPTEKTKGFADERATQMSGRLSSHKPCQVIHFEIDSFALQAAAKRRNATVTEFMLALMFMAGRYATDETKGRIQIQVPVNMRKYYQSETLRNFTMYCNIKIPIAEITDTDQCIAEIKKQMKEKASKEAMTEMMNATINLVRVLRFIPLFIKRPVAQIIYGFLGDKVFSNTLSNLGVVKLPESMAPYVEKFDFVLGTGLTNRAVCSMVTYGGTAVFVVAKLTPDPSFEEKMYQLLKENGLNPAVKGSELYGY